MKALRQTVAMTAMLASTVAIIGGSLATTAVPSSAAPGGTNVCASFTAVGTVDLVTGATTSIGTLSGCHQQGSGTTVQVVGPNQDPNAPTPVTVHWATGHATSEGITTTVPHLSGDPCPAGDVAGDVSITVVHGPYTGSTGGFVICLDLSDFPILHATSVGPVVI